MPSFQQKASPLDEEIRVASRSVIKDGYDMSVGELMSLYRSNELIINPNYQRLFRWDLSQKTKFIESLLLGIPIPPIFVFSIGRQWELVDGLQRIATILEFVGILRDPKDPMKNLPPSVLEGTKLLPSLLDARWDSSSEDADDALSDETRFELRRARIRVEILKTGSNPNAKYELFQRLNSGGSPLTEQEIRSCAIIMKNDEFFHWLEGLSQNKTFQNTLSLSERAIQRQMPLEFVIRFIVYRNVAYQKGLDVHEYLDSAIGELADTKTFDRNGEEDVFHKVFELLNQVFAENAFKRWNGTHHSGGSQLSAFEFITLGLSKQLEALQELPDPDKLRLIELRIKSLWSESFFSQSSGAGVRGSTRLANLLPRARDYFKP